MNEPSAPSSALPMPCSLSIATLVGALAKAQGAFPDIGKDKRADIQTKSGARYSYQYADLASVIGAVRKPLADNELAVLQPVRVEGTRVSVVTLLMHVSGEWVGTELTLPIADASDARSLASAITYARRYSLIALIGVAPRDEDDDGDAAVARTKLPAAKGDRILAPATPAPAAKRRPGHDPLTDAQRKKMFGEAKRFGWEIEILKHLLYDKFGIDSTTELRSGDLDAVLELIRRGPPSREPQPQGT